MRKVKTGAPVLQPLDHPAPVAPVNVIPATPVTGKPAHKLVFAEATSAPQKVAEPTWPPKPTGEGLYVDEVPDDAECPSCGETDKDLLRENTWAKAQDIQMWFWDCCYSICEGHPIHSYLYDDRCPNCDECNEHCDCAKCGNCDEKTESTCSNCNYCPDCCECTSCDDCGYKYGDVCGNCEKCENCCSCYYCESCEKKVDDDNFCHNCCHGLNCCCDCSTCDDCGNTTNNWCEEHEKCKPCCGCGQQRLDDPGWRRRGQKVVVEYEDPQYGKYLNWDPAAFMADFYLLDYMAATHVFSYCNDVELRTSLEAFADVAREKRDAVVAEIDPVFREYVDIAVGGEVRHHRAVSRMRTPDGAPISDRLDGRRERAWGEWKSVRKQLGPQALLDAAELFYDMSDGYGGKKWAAAAEILHARETGKIPAWMFVDRVFTMQHNGGMLLNKVAWKGHHRVIGDYHMCQDIGNAHHAEETALPVLLVAATTGVEVLFGEWWTLTNRIRRASGEQLLPRPSWKQHLVSESYQNMRRFRYKAKDIFVDWNVRMPSMQLKNAQHKQPMQAAKWGTGSGQVMYQGLPVTIPFEFQGINTGWLQAVVNCTLEHLVKTVLPDWENMIQDPYNAAKYAIRVDFIKWWMKQLGWTEPEEKQEKLDAIVHVAPKFFSSNIKYTFNGTTNF